MIHIINRHKHAYLHHETIKVHRPNILGNPWTHIPPKGMSPLYAKKAGIYVPTREEAVNKFRAYLINHLKNPESAVYKEIHRLVDLYLEKGTLTLACYCKDSDAEAAQPNRKKIVCHAEAIAQAIEHFAEKKRNAPPPFEEEF